MLAKQKSNVIHRNTANRPSAISQSCQLGIMNRQGLIIENQEYQYRKYPPKLAGIGFDSGCKAALIPHRQGMHP
ncbi:hypothetical protein [Chromobacterium sp. CV08]|uniref:hypothetical protein n=1 Tax=Chromobacterium sp. CV08 TaxID=3133274 RepID=UPI003DA9C187